MRSLYICLIMLQASWWVEGGSGDAYRGYKVHKLSIETQEQLDFLIQTRDALGPELVTNEVQFWDTLPTPLVEDQSLLVMLSPSQESQFLAAVDAKSIKHVVTVPDLAKAFEEEAKLSPKDQKAVKNGGMTFTAFHRYATYESWIRYLVDTFPQLVREHTVIGQSYEGRDLHLLTIGTPPPAGRTKPAIWLDAAIHSREWLAGTTLAWIVNKLVTGYSTDANAKKMLDEVDWFILPFTNPDGYEFSHTNTRLWRTTRAVNPFSPRTGADPNRNFDFYWMYSGTVQDSGSETYGGAYPFSEVENLFLTDALLERKKPIKAYMNVHCCAEKWLTPWAWSNNANQKPPHDADIRSLAVAATAALTAVHGTRYGVGTPYQALGYAASGGTIDWAIAKAGIKYSYAPELRVGYSGSGFIHRPEVIIPTGQETFEAMRVIATKVFTEFGPYIE